MQIFDPFLILLVKSYNQPCRTARQQILQAARELGVNGQKIFKILKILTFFFLVFFSGSRRRNGFLLELKSNY